MTVQSLCNARLCTRLCTVHPRVGDRAVPMKPWTEIPPITEAQFLRQVIDLARLLGWREYHPALSKWSAAGWPDLALIRPPRFILAELKRDNGKLSATQGEWLDLLRRCPGVETYLWRPAEFESIAEVLRR